MLFMVGCPINKALREQTSQSAFLTMYITYFSMPQLNSFKKWIRCINMYMSY